MKSEKNSESKKFANLLLIDYEDIRCDQRYSWKDITPADIIFHVRRENSRIYQDFVRHMIPEHELLSDLQKLINYRLSGEDLGQKLYRFIQLDFDAEEDFDIRTIDEYIKSEACLRFFPELRNNPKKMQVVALEAEREARYDFQIKQMNLY